MAKDHKQGKRGLNIIIVGCGKVGASLTEQLYKEGHDITRTIVLGALTKEEKTDYTLV